MIEKSIHFVKVGTQSEIRKFIFESFIYENIFKLKSGKTTHSGTLLQISENNKAMLIRFPDDITSYFKAGNIYELSFNNSRGKFKTEIKVTNISLKGGRTYISLDFPNSLLRLQRRRSIRVIPDYVQQPVTITLSIKGEDNLFKVRDIGLNGFSLTLSKDNTLSSLRIGEIINTEIKLPNTKLSIKCKVRIVHGNVILSKYRAGFEFLEIDSKFKNLLTNYILIRRTEIKIKILKKDSKREIAKRSIGEWLESLIEYNKERFKNFKIIILSDREEENYKAIFEHFPLTSIIKLKDYTQLENISANLIILHLTPENKNFWYKFSKLNNIKYTPLIIIYRDGSILHFLKDKPFYSKIVLEKKFQEDIIKEILIYSNITIQPVDFTILKETPLFDGNGKKVLIIDSSPFNFSMQTILNAMNFKTEITEEFPSPTKIDNFDMVIYSPTGSHSDELKNIFLILEKNKCLLLTFDRSLPYSEKLNEIFEEKNILIKPFKYDTFVNKVMFLSDEEDVNSYFKPIKIPLITQNIENLPKLIERKLQNTIYDRLFDFEIIDGNNIDIASIKNRDVIIDIHTGVIGRYPLVKFIREFSSRYKINFYGLVYQNISKQLLLNCMKAGLKNIFTIAQFVEKLKDFLIFS